MSGKHRSKKTAPDPVRPTPVLQGSRVTLRPPAAVDADAARRIGLHPEILRFFGDEPEAEWRELTPEESEELLVALTSTADRVTWVVDAGSGFIGSASLHSFGGDGTTAAYAIGLLAPDLLGHGLGTEVTRLVLAHAFDDLSLQELTVRVLEFNARAIGCYARCGFTPLRREPDAVTLDGASYADEIMHLEVRHYRRLVTTWGAEAAPSGCS
jgi:[ribosomal protein S5]-alanine N-acetyltransferase